MYEEAKISLKKFKGEQLSSEKESSEIELRNMEVIVLPHAFKEQKKQI